MKNSKPFIYSSSQEKYDVSVCIITYNEDKYIKQAIESVLLQKGNLKIEIVVCDDASSDKTRDILIDYYNKYPEMLSLYLNTQNVGISTNMFNAINNCKGKYVCLSYGDDYFIDEYKIKKQYDFIEKNKAFIGVSTLIELRYGDDDAPYSLAPQRKILDKSLDLNHYLKGIDFPTLGFMFKKEVFKNNIKDFELMVDSSLYIDDASFNIIFLEKGNIFVMKDCTAAKRCFNNKQKGNNFNSLNSKYEMCKKEIELFNNFDYLTNGRFDLSTRYGLILATAVHNYVVGGMSKNKLKYLFTLAENRYSRIKLLFSWLEGFYIKVKYKITNEWLLK